MQANDIFYSPPRGAGRPSNQQQLARMARQKAREDFTFAPIGSRRVEAITSGQQKTRVSVCFTAAASGKKCKPLILLPRKHPLKIR